MPYKMHTDDALCAVCLQHDGEVDWQEMNAARRDLNDQAKAQGLKRMLVDATSMSVLPSVTEQFEFISEHPVTLPLGVRLAIVMRPQLLSGAQFSEQVSNNRGVSMRIFPDLESARNWLSEQP
jgi:hypothetical protein